MGLLHDDYYETVKDYLHPKIHSFVNHYRCRNLIDLPPFHGCNKVSRNGTRKTILYEIGNVLRQLINAIGENQNLNTEEK